MSRQHQNAYLDALATFLAFTIAIELLSAPVASASPRARHGSCEPRLVPVETAIVAASGDLEVLAIPSLHVQFDGNEIVWRVPDGSRIQGEGSASVSAGLGFLSYRHSGKLDAPAQVTVRWPELVVEMQIPDFEMPTTTVAFIPHVSGDPSLSAPYFAESWDISRYHSSILDSALMAPYLGVQSGFANNIAEGVEATFVAGDTVSIGQLPNSVAAQIYMQAQRATWAREVRVDIVAIRPACQPKSGGRD